MAVVAHHHAALQLDDPSLHLVDEAGLVRGHDHGRAALVDAGQQLHDVDRGGGVEVSGRLVGEQDLRPVHDGTRDRDALLLTAGKLVRQPLLLAVKTHERERLGHGLLDVGARRADHLQSEGDVLKDGLVRQQPEVLEHRSDVAPEVGHLAGRERVQVAAEHDHAPLARGVFAKDQAQARRLARPRGADEKDELSALHLEVDVAEGRLVRAAVLLGDVFEPDHDPMSLSGRPMDAGRRARASRFPRRVSRRRLCACASGCRPR